MVLCGLNNEVQFQGMTPEERFATGIFRNSFHICFDKTMEEVNNDIKQYGSLTQNQGQIRISPGIRQMICSLIQWSRDLIRPGSESSLVPFLVYKVANLLRNYKSHKAYIEKSENVSDAAKPTKFRES